MGYTARLEEAFAWAAALHRDQVRKGADVPYVTHLLAVGAMVGELGGTEDQVIAGFLHDAIEDQGVTRQEIAARFGDTVADIVVACTDATTLPKPPWLPRKMAYLDHLRDQPPLVKLVVAADKLHNGRAILRDLRILGEELWGRFTATPAQTVWYYQGILEALTHEWEHPILYDLDQVVTRLVAVQPRE